MAAGGVDKPVPVRATVRMELLGSSEMIVSVPDAPPVVVGVNLTVKLAVPPGGTIVELADTLNGVPEVVIEETVSVSPPVFWIVKGTVPDKQTGTLPAFKLVGETLMWGSAPTPERATEGEGWARSLVVILRLPLKEASALGLNVTETTTDAPGAMLKGPTGAKVKCESVLPRLETNSGNPPLLVMVSGSVFGVPLRTGPKTSAEGIKVAAGNVKVTILIVEIDGSVVFAEATRAGGETFKLKSFITVPRIAPQTPSPPSSATVDPPPIIGSNVTTLLVVKLTDATKKSLGLPAKTFWPFTETDPTPPKVVFRLPISE
jgi:hypothetical protein